MHQASYKYPIVHSLMGKVGLPLSLSKSRAYGACRNVTTTLTEV